MDQGEDDHCHSIDASLAAYDGLSEVERRNLVTAATALSANGTYVSPMELISEAYIRMADGRRPWPMSKPFTAFFAGVMKSLVSDRMFLTDELKVVRLKNTMSVVRVDDLPMVAANDDSGHLQDKVVLEEIVSALESRIAGDEQLELLWAGIQCDLRGKELQQELDLDVGQLATLRTRLNRLIDKLRLEHQAKKGRS